MRRTFIAFVIVIVFSRFLKRYLKPSTPGHQLIHECCDKSKEGFKKGVKRSSGPISRIPGGDRVAVRVGVVEMGRDPPIRKQNNHIWSSGKKADVRPDCLIVEHEKFAPHGMVSHGMVSVGVCFGGKGRLHFVDEKAKVNAEYYVGRLLPELIN